MKSFRPLIDQYSPEWIESQLSQVTEQDVLHALEQASQLRRLQPEAWLALLSPKAEPFLEQMAQSSSAITQQRFGKNMQMYVPLYLSNECLCHCTYCGFSRPNSINRLTLTVEQALQEATYLHEQGFRHILLLSGEDKRFVNPKLLCEVAEKIKPLFASISVEVQPLKTEEYAQLVDAGIEGVTVYQETYNRDVYQRVHLAGKKRNYDYRLATAERAGTAGMRRIGIGALLGLSDWRHEVFHVGMHAAFLETHCWRSHVSVSLPRMRDAIGNQEDIFPVSDRYFVQALTALRLLLPNVGLVLSTRESEQLRNHLVPLGITQMSAGSKTQTGGYFEENDSDAQFEIEDQRSPSQVASMIQGHGYEVVWKDWDQQILS